MKLASTLALVCISAASGAGITYIQLASDAKPQRSFEAPTEEDRHPIADSTNCSFETEQPPKFPREKATSAAAAPSNAVSKPSNASRKNQKLERSLQQLRHQQAQVDSFRKNIDALGTQSPLRAVKNHFQSEPVDYEWSLEKEEKVLSLFESQTALQNYSPLNVSCKSETCEIVMAAETEQKGKAIYDAFLKANNQSSSGQAQTAVSYFNDPQNGQLVMYTSENGVEALFDE